jgi:hypothetical protein
MPRRAREENSTVMKRGRDRKWRRRKRKVEYLKG